MSSRTLSRFPTLINLQEIRPPVQPVALAKRTVTGFAGANQIGYHVTRQRRKVSCGSWRDGSSGWSVRPWSTSSCGNRDRFSVSCSMAETFFSYCPLFLRTRKAKQTKNIRVFRSSSSENEGRYPEPKKGELFCESRLAVTAVRHRRGHGRSQDQPWTGHDCQAKNLAGSGNK